MKLIVHLRFPRPRRHSSTAVPAALAAAFAVVASACAPPDRPARLLPTEFREWVQPDSLRAEGLAPGVRYRFVWSSRGPWALHLLQVDLGRCELALEVLRAPSREEESGGRARVSELVAAGPAPGALAAVNGDFFTPEGTPLGPELAAGKARSLRPRPVLAWDTNTVPWIETARVLGDSLFVAGGIRLRRDGSPPSGWTPTSEEVPRKRDPDPRSSRAPPAGVVAGYPELLDHGVRVDSLLVDRNPAFAASRHPRTAVGWDPARRTLWIVVVDGRQGRYSVGMTLPELTTVFERLGATEALNLDGGGSSVMVVRGEAVSRPSDEAGERPVVNALLLRRDARYCREPRSSTDA